MNHKLETCKVYYLLLSEYSFQRMDVCKHKRTEDDQNELA